MHIKNCTMLIDVLEFKGQNQLPLSRIRKIMKSNNEVKMISAEATLLFAKACELLIEELTIRAWLAKDCSKRRTLHRCDIARAIRQQEVFDFLIDLLPSVDHKDNKSEKHSNEAEVHPANQVAFPIISINDDNQYLHVKERKAFKGKKIA
ncbi:Histone H2A/H2B/H3 [Dillenia turbinata]|uniref:Histone H2A/H2B/H3 n=1 Tax=Dillenia turbinata TaxID=194707 RepID=A0AAN8VDK8_9MAGN